MIHLRMDLKVMDYNMGPYNKDLLRSDTITYVPWFKKRI